MMARLLPLSLAFIGLISSVCCLSYDELLGNLYRLSELEDLQTRDHNRYEPISGLDNRNAGWDDIEYSDLLNEAQLRDQEYEQHNPLYGYQYMSGGAGEGVQHLTPTGEQKNDQQVKTNKVLPAYCNPPNPCPVGYTEEDGCVENFENSADNNRDFNSKQECACDAEHMFKCPQGSQKINTKSEEETTPDVEELTKVMDELTELGDSDTVFLKPYTNGEKRHSRVAKKTPHLIKKRSTMEEFIAEGMELPYMAEGKLHRVAKKSPYYLG